MNIEDLIEAAHETVIDDDIVEQLQRRLEIAEAKFEQEAKEKQITQAWLNKEYTLWTRPDIWRKKG